MITKHFSALQAGITAIIAVSVSFFLLTSITLAAPAPADCTIKILQGNTVGNIATLAWTSDSTLFGEVVNNTTGEVIGTSPDGLRVVNTAIPTTYTLRAWNSTGETITCSTGVGNGVVFSGTGGPIDGGNPTVAVVSTKVPGYVTLSDLPYTGLEDTVMTLMTILFALMTIITVGYIGRKELIETLKTLRG